MPFALMSKKYTQLFSTAGLLVSLLFSSSSMASQTTSSSAESALIIGGVKFPPLTYVSDDGNIYGPGIDQLDTFFAQLDEPYQWLGMAQNRLYREITAGNLDLTIVTKKHNELDEQLYFAKRPFVCLSIDIFSKPNHQALNQLSDLQNKTLLYYYYFEKEELFEKIKQIPGITLHSIDNRGSAIDMLKMSRADYLLDFGIPIYANLLNTGVTLESNVIHTEEGYIASPKSREGAQALIEKIDALMEKTKFVMKLPGKSTAVNQPCPAR